MLLAFVGLVIKAVVLIVALLTGFAYMTWGERRIVARMQWRVGPNMVGPFGLLQPLADGLKLLFKEQLQPEEARTLLFVLAPCISFIVAMCAYAVLPIDYQLAQFLHPGSPVVHDLWNFGSHQAPEALANFFGAVPDPQQPGSFIFTMRPWLADVDVAVLYLLGISSLGVYGIILGGWSSNNKYALLGGIRSSAQVISYELALGTALISPLLMVGNLSFLQISLQQALPYLDQGGWFIFSQPVAFCLYCIAAVAEVNRAPFDLPEAEQELGAGYHTEYSGMKFAMFFMAEYVNMFTVSTVATTVFLGGPGGLTFLDPDASWMNRILAHGPWWFLLKVYFFMFVFIWLRATFPRFRYDQLMRIGWQFLLPLGLVNLGVTAVGVALRWRSYQFTLAIALMMLVMVGVSMLNRKPASHGHGHH